jgi:hypothetical protein
MTPVSKNIEFESEKHLSILNESITEHVKFILKHKLPCGFEPIVDTNFSRGIISISCPNNGSVLHDINVWFDKVGSTWVTHVYVNADYPYSKELDDLIKVVYKIFASEVRNNYDFEDFTNIINRLS